MATRSLLRDSSMLAGNDAFRSAPGSGYWGMGSDTNTIDYANFATESASRLIATSHSGKAGAGASDSLTKGYFFGGFSGCCSMLSTVTKLTFSTQTTSGVTGMSTATYGKQAMESSVAAYATGGDNAGSYPNGVDKYTFSNDSRSTLAAGHGLGSTGNGGGFSSASSGYITAGLADSTVIRKIDFSTGSISTTTSLLTSTLDKSVHAFESPSHGYIGIGEAAFNKFNLSDDTISALAFSPHAGTNAADSAVDEYTAYSNRSDSTNGSKMVFATDTYSTVTGMFVSQKSLPSAFNGA